ncbi:hypothetical protein CP532_3269 [Ophiocordyceps camponoti-leonardi (nom. inval.)]|nr:hypothetical protein CP532_3269 [Ophiocordyceps camponoti-leonardi (nom. inval.)]
MLLRIIVGLLALAIVYGILSSRKTGPSLPPGPKGLPIIGNIMDLPPADMPEHLHWLKHREAYGPISSVTVMGRTLILLHDKQAAFDLLEKKSTMTAGRPQLAFASMSAFDQFLAFQTYDERFRRARRFVDHQLGTRARVARFDEVQEVEVRRFLLRVLKQPDDVHRHLHTMAGAIVLKMTYGYSIKPDQPDPLVELSERMASNLSRAAVPLARLVDVMPFLKYLPDAFPGTAFKKTARQWAKVNEALVEIPYSLVRRQMATGDYPPSYTSDLVDQHSDNKDTAEAPKRLRADDEHTIKWTAVILYATGSETTASSLSSFILAMVLFPRVQRYGEPRHEPHPKSIAFGFGRRILAAFAISKAVDGSGREIEAKLETVAGIVNKVKDFPCKIRPRSPQAAKLIRDIELEKPWGRGWWVCLAR